MPRIILPCAALLVCLLGLSPLPAAETPLSDLDLSGMKQGWGRPQADAAVDGPALRVAGKSYDVGIGTHAPAIWKLNLAGKATEFRALVGVQEYPDNPGVGTVEFIVRGDGKDLFRSGVMRGGDPARPVRVALQGVKELTLEVTDGGDGTASDHADWLDPVIVHDDAPLPGLKAVTFEPDEPGVPPNRPGAVDWDPKTGKLTLSYRDGTVFEGRVQAAAGTPVEFSAPVRNRRGVEQHLTLRGTGLSLTGQVQGSTTALAAETCGTAQQNFPLVRTSHGPSRSFRNNAIYDRQWDWQLAAPADGTTRIMPVGESTAGRAFSLTVTGDTIDLVFRPRFYQRHKGLRYFKPWAYQVRQDSITGWCSWWAYRANFKESDLKQLVAVWDRQHLRDFGYRFIQIDDTYQSGNGLPANWLHWNSKFPSGLAGYVDGVRAIGCEPAVWLYASFNEAAVVQQHPDWFVRGANGKPLKAPWLFYGMDSTNPEVAKTLVRPTFRGFHDAGMTYVKIDALRHLRYDCLNNAPGYAKSKGLTNAELFRTYLRLAREELGPDTYILACWGIQPDAVGLADGCRLGGDGYGPLTLQQFNSWNGIVWRNDPDHCDVRPSWSPAEVGNVSKLKTVTSGRKDAILRPTLASVAGAMLMLSDRAEVYRDPANIEGAKRAAPVLFSVPGQLYDFIPDASNNVRRVDPDSITAGSGESLFDAKQFGAVNEWWLNEIDLPFEHWTVLTRLNWTEKTHPAATVKFADLGLDPAKEYLVYEFWTKQFLGVCRGSFLSPISEPKDTQTYAIREKLDRPQIVSTSRHISQGGVDLRAVDWQDNTLAGRSNVVGGDRYELLLHLPAGYTVKTATLGGKPAEIQAHDATVSVGFTPTATGEVPWSVEFSGPGRP